MRRGSVQLRRVRGTLALAALLASACATPAPRKEVVWPAPPDVARVRFVRAFGAEADLGPSGWQMFARAITGEQSPLRVVQATGVAVGNDEKKIYVAQPSGLLCFDLESKVVTQVGTQPGYELSLPFDLDFDAEGAMYVSDSVRHSVMVYAPDGAFRAEIGKAELVRPTGIAIDRARGLLYVADSANKASDHHVIEVYKLAGEHVRTIGKKGTGPGELYFPVYLALSPAGEIYVGDVMNFRIQIFDSEGKLRGSFGEAGDTYGKFGRIKGLAFDAFGNLHVADGEYGLVQILNARHEPLMYYGGRAAALEFFDMPTGIAVDSKNNLYVANFYIGRVNQYQIINTKAEDSFMTPDDSAPAPETPKTATPAAAPAQVEHVGAH